MHGEEKHDQRRTVLSLVEKNEIGQKRGVKKGGERGIRTPGELPHNGFQDRRLKPLGHLSVFLNFTKQVANVTIGLRQLRESAKVSSMIERIKQKAQLSLRILVQMIVAPPLLFMSAESSGAPSFVLRMVGDTYLQKNRTDEELAAIRDGLAKGADAVVCNLEGVLSDGAVEQHVSKRFLMKMPSRAALDLKKMGISHVTIANNHAFDFGQKGLVETKSSLNRYKIPSAGTGSSVGHALAPLRIATSNGDLCIFAFSNVYPSEHWATSVRAGIAPGKFELVAHALNQTKNCWSKVVSFHWGREREFATQKYQNQLANLSVMQGASAVVGHHAHVVQSAEWILDAPVIYSLGNFVFDTLPNRSNPEGIAVDLEFSDKGRVDRVKITPWHVNNRMNRFHPKPMQSESQYSTGINSRIGKLNCTKGMIPWICKLGVK